MTDEYPQYVQGDEFSVAAPGTRGVIQGKGRGQVVVPEGLMTLIAKMRPDAIQHRKRLAAGLAPKDLLAPATGNPAAFDSKKGQVAIALCKQGTTFRGAPGNDAGSSVEVVVNMAGLSATTLNQMSMVGVIQNSRALGTDPQEENTVTFVPRGKQTVEFDSSAPEVCVGQRLCADPYSPMTEVDGKKTVSIQQHGTAEGFAPINLRPIASNTIDAMEHAYKERLQVELGKVVGGQSSSALRTVFQKMVANVKTDDHLASHMPIAGFLSVWIAYFYANVMAADGKFQEAYNGLVVLHANMLEVERTFSNIKLNYDAALPHNFLDKSNQQKGHLRGLRATHILELVDESKMSAAFANPATGTVKFIKLLAEMNMWATHYMGVFRSEQAAWFHKFDFATALSTSSAGNPVDIFMSK